MCYLAWDFADVMKLRVLEMGRLSWVTDEIQCNHEGPEKSETGGFELEKR